MSHFWGPLHCRQLHLKPVLSGTKSLIELTYEAHARTAHGPDWPSEGVTGLPVRSRSRTNQPACKTDGINGRHLLQSLSVAAAWTLCGEIDYVPLKAQNPSLLHRNLPSRFRT